MSFDPLLSAPPQIQIHTFSAFGAFVLGAWQLAAPKGARAHRVLGWVGVALMVAVCVSAMFISTIRLWGPFSPIHLLALQTGVQLPLSIRAARLHRVAEHRKNMLLMYAGALIIAGAFTFWPGRIMHEVVFGE